MKNIGCLTLLLLCFNFFIKIVPKEPNTAHFDQTVFEWTKSFAEVVHIIHNKYHESIDPEKAMINAINAFISTLDPHSCFMDPKAFKDILETTQGEFYGIGVVIDNTKEPEQEFLKTDLGDHRLNKRLIAERLSESPEYPINQTCESWAETKAAYLFFQNDSGTREEV